jgi:hypothetical protein
MLALIDSKLRPYNDPLPLSLLRATARVSIRCVAEIRENHGSFDFSFQILSNHSCEEKVRNKSANF